MKEDLERLAAQWTRIANAIEAALPVDDADYGAPSQDRDFATARTLRECAAEVLIVAEYQEGSP